MPRELDPQLEASARRQLTRLIDSIETTPPELVDMNRPSGLPSPLELDEARARAAARRRRRLIMASMTVAAAAAVALVLVVPGDSDGEDDVISDQLPRTATTPSTTDTTAPDPAVDGQATGPADEECQLDVADDGLVSSGQTPDGRLWEYRVGGQLPDVNSQVLVDGASAEGTYSAATGQDGPLSNGQLRQGRTEITGDVVESVEDVAVPASAQTVDVYVWDGAQRTRLQLCPMAIPGVDGLKYAATFVPHGSELMAVIALDGDGQPVAHSENVSIPDDGGPEAMTELAGGELGSSRWSFQVGGDAELLAVKLDLPGPEGEGGGAAVRSRPDLLQDAWHASSVWDGSAGRYFLWGYTRPDVAEVVMTMYDGTVFRIPTMATGLPSVGGRVFAAEFPTANGPAVRLIEGHSADGTVLVELADPDSGSIGNGMPEQANVRVAMRDVG